MQITRKDIGYTIYSRLEESFRLWISEELLKMFGNEWHLQIPEGVLNKVTERSYIASFKDVDHPMDLLDETDITDLMEIMCYKKAFSNFIPQEISTVEKFRDKINKLYGIRIKIAHVKRSFSAIDLDLLIEIAESFLPIIGSMGDDLKETLKCIKSNPDKIVIRMPVDFIIQEIQPSSPYITNLPPGDYDPDGGFIGRKEDLNKIMNLILGNLHRVITISGAGGVGKTAIAHQICQNLLNKSDLPFDAIVWVSAKEEKLTITGIEPIEPTLLNYESVLDSILETFGWVDDLTKPITNKEESSHIILQAGNKGVLLVIDNLETIRDERVIEFIKDFPPPSKVLITSRLGLGEVERRYPLKEMNIKDAIILLRTIAKEKRVKTLVELPDSILSKYVDKMSRYPLAIKWVIGQVALGKDINIAIGDLTSSTGDVAKFCFEHIFDSLLNEEARTVLYALAANDKPITRGVLSHVSNLSPENLDIALRSLTIASLVIPAHNKSADGTIETRYELLPLTRNYIQSKLKSHPEIHRDIKNRTEMVQSLIEEADRAGRYYRYSLRDMGAESEEEKIAATWSITAYQRYQAGDYDIAVEHFNKAAQIAPNFPAVYRNWATMETEAGFYEKADELMKKATKLNSKDSRIWFVWGNIEKHRQRLDRAYGYFKKALDLSPKDAVILGSLGEVEKRRNNFENADKLLKKALKEGASDVSSRRHEIICNTSLADNLRRWSELLLRDRRSEDALNKLKESYKIASEVAKLAKDDYRAQDTFREVSLSLAYLLLHLEGLHKAKQYFEDAIVQSPRRAKEKKITAAACYKIANTLIEDGNIEEARKYYNMGRKSLLHYSNLNEHYKTLALEFSQNRSKGKLYRIIEGKGYGFLELEGQTGQTVFLHYSEVLPEISDGEFENMKDSIFSFFVEKTDKGLAAKRVRLIGK